MQRFCEVELAGLEPAASWVRSRSYCLVVTSGVRKSIDSSFQSTGLCDRIGSVPTISRFFGIVIAMYFDDHGPPHFHARHADGGAKVQIDTLEVIESTLGRRQLRIVLAWAELHQDELLANWRLARAGETLQEIDPLR